MPDLDSRKYASAPDDWQGAIGDWQALREFNVGLNRKVRQR